MFHYFAGIKLVKMNSITLIRKKLGLKQEEIAQWLGISRSLVSNYEREERSLPREASMQLTRLEIVFGKMETNKGLPNKNSLSPERKMLAQQQHKWFMEDCALKAAMLSRRLAAMQRKHDQIINRIEMLEILLNEPTDKNDKFSLSWVRTRLTKAKKSLESCDEVQQQKLKLNIKMHEKASKIKMDEL